MLVSMLKYGVYSISNAVCREVWMSVSQSPFSMGWSWLAAVSTSLESDTMRGVI